MATKLPFLDTNDFFKRVRELDAPASSPEHELQRTVDVLLYLGQPAHWPSWLEKHDHQRAVFNDRVLQAIERTDWKLYTDNFVYIPSNMYGYLAECMRRDDPFVEQLRKTDFAKLCAIAYALVVDVDPNRRGNILPRIEAWSGQDIDENAPNMLGALFDAWSQEDAAIKFGSYGAMLKVLDPQSSRQASVLTHLLAQMRGQTPMLKESIAFDFDASH